MPSPVGLSMSKREAIAVVVAEVLRPGSVSEPQLRAAVAVLTA